MPECPDPANYWCYHDLKEGFSKTKATFLLLHRPYDRPIELLPRTAPPVGHLYSLSPPETDAMRDYIKLSREASIIRPSSSPAGTGSSLVKRTNHCAHTLTIEV